MHLFEHHPRTHGGNRYVYPVISRRSGGLSIGINLSVEKLCNFHCIYCQVDRGEPGRTREERAQPQPSPSPRSLVPAPVEMPRLADELDAMVDAVLSGRLFEGPPLRETPPALRRWNDIALSGDGEPTSSRSFEEVVQLCAEVRRRRQLETLKLVLITNASMLHLPRVRRGLAVLDANGGEIWGKLDAGTEDYYRQVNRSAADWRRILDNLREAAQARPIVIQSLFMRIHGAPPPAAEIAAYADRLAEILAAGGRIKLVQVYTIAREPSEAWASALSPGELEGIAEAVGGRTKLPVAAFA
jgi:wyosine [tRNA(Phe)-imidazoG37] synthetase (radical SAM superfamily)